MCAWRMVYVYACKYIPGYAWVVLRGVRIERGWLCNALKV